MGRRRDTGETLSAVHTLVEPEQGTKSLVIISTRSASLYCEARERYQNASRRQYRAAHRAGDF